MSGEICEGGRAKKKNRKHKLNIDLGEKAEQQLEALVLSGRCSCKTDAAHHAVRLYYTLTQLPLGAEVRVHYRDGNQALVMMV